MNEIQYIQKHGANKARYPAYGRLTDQLQEDGFTGDLDALIRLISACEMVELLGGYEEAKKEFAEQLNADKPYPNETENNKRILLDYRRANNIFELGDHVLTLNECFSTNLTKALMTNKAATNAAIKPTEIFTKLSEVKTLALRNKS